MLLVFGPRRGVRPGQESDIVRRQLTWMAAVVLVAMLVPAATPGPSTEAGLELTVAAAPNAGAVRPTLSLGARGEPVRALQERLRALHAQIVVDSRFGAATRQAVMALQTARGLPADGIVGPQTWRALDGGGLPLPVHGPLSPSSPRPTLRLGSTGAAVGTAQQLLTRAGQHLSADGRFGPRTESAVLAFQRARHLSADGVIGPVTWAALSPGATVTPVQISLTRPAWRTFGARSYVVRPGDTLASVARSTGSTAAALASANRIRPGGSLTVGSTISVPGAWRCPAPGAGFIDDFGYPRVGHLHQGIDMFASRNTPVVAPLAGRVVQHVGGLGGNTVQLYGVDGNRYYFGHLDHFGATGDVGAGAVVGYVGNSGDAVTTSTHLHFEIHPGGAAQAVDPFSSLTLACKH